MAEARMPHWSLQDRKVPLRVLYLVKTDASGTPEWSRNFGGANYVVSSGGASTTGTSLTSHGGMANTRRSRAYLLRRVR